MLAEFKALRNHYVSDAQMSSPRDSGPAGSEKLVSVARGSGILACSRCISHLRVQNSDLETFPVTDITL